MAVLVCFLLLTSAILAFASDVPVLMWSPERPLSDLPQAPVADSIGQDNFHAQYLKPLVGKESPVLVAFLQDKLHVNDISKYADVYNQESVGGAFKNIKSLMDEHFSLELPRVLGSHLALDTLRKDFPGTVIDLTSGSDLSSLDLEGKGSYLMIVQMQPVRGALNEEAAIAANDKLVAEVCRHLEKRSVKYTALYTAQSSAQKVSGDKESRFARHLLDTGETYSNGSFFNVSYEINRTNVYVYLSSISICMVYSYSEKDPPTVCPTNFTVSGEQIRNSTQVTAAEGDNNTLSVELRIGEITTNYSTEAFNLTLEMRFTFNFDRWIINNFYLTITNQTQTVINQEEMVTRGYDNVVVQIYSYHCSSYEWFPKNMSATPLSTITLGDFQVQPFNTSLHGFDLAQDCVAWFTTAIWMALFVLGIHLVVLFFGMYLITSLSTNDRFDDPKGKPLVINAGDTS